MDLKKIDSTISELEKQTEGLKNFGKIFTEITNIKKDLVENLKLLDTSNDNIRKANEKIQELNKINKNFQKKLEETMLTQLNEHKTDIHRDIRNENRESQKIIEATKTVIIDNLLHQLKLLNRLQIAMFALITVILIACWILFKN